MQLFHGSEVHSPVDVEGEAWESIPGGRDGGGKDREGMRQVSLKNGN